ncbi:MAG: hypothetical protein HFF06_04010 [Oscillospiraceae bacterium]|jgi:type II secretory pathway pseudopilin PulG|nr:hypothetical protein [Oscillospiraceae bacterium]
MRSKAPLALMEQMVMLLVFALAAALCLQAFVLSDKLSRREEARSRAAQVCQSAAEAIRHSGGTGEEALSGGAEILGAEYSDGLLQQTYDRDWEPVAGTAWAQADPAYRLTAVAEDGGQLGLGLAQVKVYDVEEEELLFQLEVAWQTPGDAGISQADKDRARREAENMAQEILACAEGGLDFRETISGETDGLGGWRRYFDEDWNTEFSYDRAVFTLWYSQEKVVAGWNQRDEKGFATGGNVPLCTVELGEVRGHD